MTKHYVVLAVIAAVVLGVVIYGFSVAGLPTDVRKMKFDEQRVGDLSNISYQIASYYSTNRMLPADMASLRKDFQNEGLKGRGYEDPETSKDYDYQAVTSSTYKLCATFSTDSNNQPGSYDYYNSSRNHKSGYDCINYTIPDYYLKNSAPASTTTVSCTSTASGGGIIFDFDLTATLESAPSSTSTKQVNVRWKTGSAITNISDFRLERTANCLFYGPIETLASSTGLYKDIMQSSASGRWCYLIEGYDKAGIIRKSNVACVDVP